jgi:hypothetical protein
MQWSDISVQPSPRVLRQFASCGIVFSCAWAAWVWAVHDRPGLALLSALPVSVGLIGIAKPSLIRPLYVSLLVVVFPIGWLVSNLILAVIFYGLITPLGLFFRLAGRDVMGRDFEPQRESYWAAKPAATAVRAYFRQF